MTDRTSIAGAVAVATIQTLAPWEATLLLNLRLWLDGPEGQREVWTEYAESFSGASAHQPMRRFERLLNIIGTHASRPLVRRGVLCACVGSDERVFVHLVSTASAGHLDEAAKIATLLVGAEWAQSLAELAQKVGSDTQTLQSHARPRANRRSGITIH